MAEKEEDCLSSSLPQSSSVLSEDQETERI